MKNIQPYGQNFVSVVSITPPRVKDIESWKIITRSTSIIHRIEPVFGHPQTFGSARALASWVANLPEINIGTIYCHQWFRDTILLTHSAATTPTEHPPLFGLLSIQGWGSIKIHNFLLFNQNFSFQFIQEQNIWVYSILAMRLKHSAFWHSVFWQLDF